ncbi:MAG TPA: hypothetical protein VJB11_01510 [archaeon]|nr:hypothetical protein [archaeon]
MILIDTSVYIAAITDKEVEKLLMAAGKKKFVISSEVIEKEINSASDFLRKKGDKSGAERLKDIYNSTISGTIKLTDRVIALSTKYASEVKNRISNARAQEMKDDFRIVSSASVGSIEAIATFNRKTMSNPEIVAIYKEVNGKNSMKTPEFIRTKDELASLLSRS